MSKSTYSKEKNPYIYLKDDDKEDQPRCFLFTVWKEGYLAAVKELGWKRNCPETPIPNHEEVDNSVDRLLNIAFEYHDKRVIDIVANFEHNGWYYVGYRQLWLPPWGITHWMETPEVDDE